MSVKFLSTILEPEMAAPILWAPGKMHPFCRKGWFGFNELLGGGGGKCRFYLLHSVAHRVSQQISAESEMSRQNRATPPTQRALRSKKFNPDRNFQSRSKFLISLENFNLDLSISPTKTRAAVGGSLENFILARNFQSRSKSRIPEGQRRTN